MNTPLDLDQFVAIVDAGSISAASRQLAEPRATLSRRLARLEEHFGVRLLHRSTRRLALTRAGDELYRRATRIVAEVHDAEQAIRRLDGPPRGRLRITVPGGPIVAIMGEILGRFLSDYPLVEPEVLSTNRHVDLIGEGYDVAIRAGTRIDPSLIARVLLRIRVIAVASPAYLEAHGTPRTADDLTDHACLAQSDSTGRPTRQWPLVDGGAVRITARASANDPRVVAVLAMAGHGITLIPDQLVEEALAEGRLVPVLTDVVGTSSTAALVYPERRLIEPQVRAFIDFAIAWFEASGRWAGLDGLGRTQ